MGVGASAGITSALQFLWMDAAYTAAAQAGPDEGTLYDERVRAGNLHQAVGTTALVTGGVVIAGTGAHRVLVTRQKKETREAVRQRASSPG